MFSSFGFQWPVQLTKLFAASSMSTFNEQLMAPECSFGAWSFELKCVLGRTCSAYLVSVCGEAPCFFVCAYVRDCCRWYMMQAVPLVFLGGLLGLAVVYRMRVRCARYGSTRAACSFRSVHWSVTMTRRVCLRAGVLEAVAPRTLACPGTLHRGLPAHASVRSRLFFVGVLRFSFTASFAMFASPAVCRLPGPRELEGAARCPPPPPPNPPWMGRCCPA